MENSKPGLGRWTIVLVLIGGLLLGCIAGGLAGGIAGYFAGRRQARGLARSALRTELPHLLLQEWPRLSRELPKGRSPVLTQPFSGVLVRQVEPDSPAAKAELRAGDLIVAVDGQEVVHMNYTLSRILADYGPGDKVTLTVRRNDQELKLDVMLGSKEGKAYLGIYYTVLPIAPLQPR